MPSYLFSFFGVCGVIFVWTHSNLNYQSHEYLWNYAMDKISPRLILRIFLEHSSFFQNMSKSMSGQRGNYSPGLKLRIILFALEIHLIKLILLELRNVASLIKIKSLKLISGFFMWKTVHLYVPMNIVEFSLIFLFGKIFTNLRFLTKFTSYNLSVYSPHE